MPATQAPAQAPSQSTSAQTLELAGQALQISSTAIASTIDSANATDRARLSQDAIIRRDQIILQIAETRATDPVAAENLRLSAQALQLVIDALRNPPPSNMVVLVSAGVGLLALGGIAWLVWGDKR